MTSHLPWVQASLLQSTVPALSVVIWQLQLGQPEVLLGSWHSFPSLSLHFADCQSCGAILLANGMPIAATSGLESCWPTA